LNFVCDILSESVLSASTYRPKSSCITPGQTMNISLIELPCYVITVHLQDQSPWIPGYNF